MQWQRAQRKRETQPHTNNPLFDDEVALHIRPEQSPLAGDAAAVWQFCDGYRPDLWPYADAAVGPFDDWRALIDLQQHLKAETRG